MRRYLTLILFGILLLVLAGVLHYFHYLFFRDVHHILIYMFGDLAFLPLEVLFVVLVIERVMADREQRAKLKKLNMVIGAFYSEVGNYLLGFISSCCKEKQQMRRYFGVSSDWNRADFKNSITAANAMLLTLDLNPEDFKELKAFLIGKRTFLLRLLENPNLLEHEKFTNLLWATFHLTEELEERVSFDAMSGNDKAHLVMDVQRVFGNLVAEWLEYVEHLKNNYPYLFSLIVRTHPFQETPAAVIN